MAADAMKAQVEAVLQAVAADIAQHGFDAEFVERSVARMRALTVDTEDDRRQHLAGYLRLAQFLAAQAPAEAAEAYAQQRDLAAAYVEQLYGHDDTPYLGANRIVARLFDALKDGAALESSVEQALAAVEALPFDDSAHDVVVRLGAMLRIRALERARGWLAQDSHDGPVDETLALTVGHIEQAAADGKLDTALFIKFAQTIREPDDATPEMRRIVASMLLVVYGLALMFRLEAAPGLEPLRDRIAALVQDDAPAPPGVASKCEAALAAFAATLERDGFSEYAFREATAALQEIPTDSAADAEAVHSALLRVLDIALPHAPTEAAQALRVTREGLEAQMVATTEAPPLTVEAMEAECATVVQTLRRALEAGEAPAAVILQAINALRALGMGLGDGADEAVARVVMRAMLEVPQVVLPYAPEHADLQFREAMATMQLAVAGLDVPAAEDDPAAAAVYRQALHEQMRRHSQSADARVLAKDEPPPVRQFLDLLPSFLERLMRPVPEPEAGSQDAQEIKRLDQRFDRDAKVWAAATTEAQYLRHQRGALRRVAVELRQFERRRQLMLVRPPLPTDEVTIDANVVFFSGGDAAGALIGEACVLLGLDLAPQRAADNAVHARWQQLRASALAVFDFGAYDPALADPPGPVPGTRDAEAVVLGAAGSVAQVAFEAGWAFVLGTPIVIVARQGQSVPFDIDIDPVRLHGDGHDAPRLAAALQATLYGVQRGVGGDSLAATVAEVRAAWAGTADAQAQKLLASLSDLRDATRVRRTLRALLDRGHTERALLALPAFAPRHPPPGAPRLFHVAAFRDWGKVAQSEARGACERAGVDYRIGYERLGPDVLRTVWDDLCEASFVLVDITNLNPNAVLELAIAQALGRRMLVLTQNVEPHAHLPAIRHLRTHRYGPRGRAALRRLLDGFLAGAT